jgi:hypothetical protein
LKIMAATLFRWPPPPARRPDDASHRRAYADLSLRAAVRGERRRAPQSRKRIKDAIDARGSNLSRARGDKLGNPSGETNVVIARYEHHDKR